MSIIRVVYEGKRIRIPLGENSQNKNCLSFTEGLLEYSVENNLFVRVVPDEKYTVRDGYLLSTIFVPLSRLCEYVMNSHNKNEEILDIRHDEHLKCFIVHTSAQEYESYVIPYQVMKPEELIYEMKLKTARGVIGIKLGSEFPVDEASNEFYRRFNIRVITGEVIDLNKHMEAIEPYILHSYGYSQYDYSHNTTHTLMASPNLNEYYILDSKMNIVQKIPISYMEDNIQITKNERYERIF